MVEKKKEDVRSIADLSLLKCKLRRWKCLGVRFGMARTSLDSGKTNRIMEGTSGPRLDRSGGARIIYECNDFVMLIIPIACPHSTMFRCVCRNDVLELAFVAFMAHEALELSSGDIVGHAQYLKY